MSSFTVRQVVDQVVGLGLVEPHLPGQELSPDVFDKSLNYYGEADSVALLGLLDEFGIVYTADYKTFRRACDDGGWGYQDELEQIAAGTRGSLTITDVEFVDDEPGRHRLSFRANGTAREWSIRHGDDEGFDVQLQLTDRILGLVPRTASPRWCDVDPYNPDYSTQVVFGDPASLNRLGAPFGLTFD